MSENIVLQTLEMGFPWRTADPFLFCVHHLDTYPEGNDAMGPAVGTAGRQIGMDFGGKDGWSMYHGDVVPGFPRHPHRGFETITLARQGYIDHSDSLGATARFGKGDVQWMTAGQGVVHSEMFPLIHRDKPNTTELFQIWLNLPRASKLVKPHFTMMWSHTIPRFTFTDEAGRETEVVTIAGAFDAEHTPPSPPPDSWAAREEAQVAVWTLRMAPGATWTLPAGGPDLNRTLYPFSGASAQIAEAAVKPGTGVRVRSDVEVPIENTGDVELELVLLQGRPIGEPVAQHGPFVMNTPGELRQAFADYHQTGFGGWPFDADAPVHPREQERFARHADGRVEHATEA